MRVWRSEQTLLPTRFRRSGYRANATPGGSPLAPVQARCSRSGRAASRRAHSHDASGGLEVDDPPDEFRARMDLKLAIDARQVELHRLRAEEEAGADVAVREALGDDESDLQLLRRQLLGVARVAPPNVLAGGTQFHACPL